MAEQTTLGDDLAVQVGLQHDPAVDGPLVLAQEESDGVVVVLGEQFDGVGGQVRTAGGAAAQKDVGRPGALPQDVRIGAAAHPFDRMQPVGRADGDVDGGTFGLRQLGSYRYGQPDAVRVVAGQGADDVDGHVEVGRQFAPLRLFAALP